MAAVVRITVLTSTTPSQDHVNGLARLVETEERRTAIEADVLAEATVEEISQAKFSAELAALATPKPKRQRKASAPKKPVSARKAVEAPQPKRPQPALPSPSKPVR